MSLTVANQQKQLSQWCKIQMDEVQTTAHSEEIEEKMAKELLEEGKTSQVILGPMFYLEKKKRIDQQKRLLSDLRVE